MTDAASVNVFSAQVGYSIPVAVPSAGNLAPSLAFDYSGALGNGVLGVGWSLRAPAIRRSLHEGVPAYAPEDELLLEGFGGGGRLVPIGGNEYRVEGQGNALRIRRVGDRFVVNDSDGLVYLLGASPAERQTGPRGVAAWFASEITDTGGHKASFRYVKSQGQVYIDQVTWGPAQRFQARFEYENRPDPVVSFAFGFRVVTAQRLSLVRVLAGEELKAYHLSYDDDRPMSRLVQVRVTGRGGAGELPRVTFSYARTQPARTVQLGNTGGWVLDQRGVTIADVDGDGIDDLLRLELGHHEWRRNLGGQFLDAQPIPGAADVELEASRLLDLDGDARPELVRVVDETWRYSRLVGGVAWAASQQWAGTAGVPLAEGEGVTMADINGDGRTDVIEATTAGLRIHRAAKRGLGPAFSVGPIDPTNREVEPGSPAVKLVDVNGDGLVDAVWLTDAWMKVFLGRGDGTFEALTKMVYPWGGGALDPSTVHFADANRDGLVDLVRLVAGNVLLYYGRGDHHFDDRPRHLARPESTDVDVLVTLGDVNGNGSLDVVWSSPRGLWALDLAGATTDGMLESIDNGLGMVTVFTYAASGPLSVAAARAGNPWERNLPISVPVPVQMETQLADGTPSRTVQYGVRNGFWDGEDRRFGGFLESRRVMPGSTAADTRVELTRYLAGEGQDRELRGRTALERIEDGLGRPYSQSETVWETRRVGDLPDVPLLRCAVAPEQRKSTYEGSTTPIVVRSTSTFDSECRTIRLSEEGRLDVVGDERVTVKEYASDPGLWVRDRLVEETIYSGSGELVSRTRHFYGDETTTVPEFRHVGKGWPVAKQAWLADASGGGRWVTKSATTYDANQNVVRSFAEGVSRRMEWSSDGLYPIREVLTPSPGRELAWSVTWDVVLGRPTSVTDPNGDLVRADYDALGRVVALSANGASAHTRFEYLWTAPRPATVTYSFDGAAAELPARAQSWRDGAPWRQSVVVVNGAGEDLYRALRLGPTRWAISGWKERDRRGRVVTVADPFHWDQAVLPVARPPGVDLQLLRYDALDRTVEQQLATGARTRTSYSAFCQQVDTDGVAPVLSCGDGLERPIHTERVVDGISELVDASYNPAGQIVSMRLQGGLVEHSFQYDTLGRLLVARDPDVGARTMEYDDDGHVVASVNAAGQRTTYAYDGTGRLLRRTGRDGTAFVYHYDEPYPGTAEAHARGRLGWVEEPTGHVDVGYDGLGRTVRWARTIDGITASKSQVLSPSGLLLREVFDDGFAIDYSYDAGGRMDRVGSLWQAITRDAAGRLLDERFANGLTNHIDYDHAGQSKRVSLTRPGAAALYDVELLRNEYGAVTRAIDRDGVGLDQNATFTYDLAGRLAGATMGTGAQTYAFGYAYDGLENLVARTATGPRDLGILTGTYRYGENGRGPRQLTSVQAPTLMRASTVAGGGQVSGDGGGAVLARLSSPGGPSAFANESFVFAEPGSQRIRKVAPNGTISTLAGTGAGGYAGDGGPASAARVNQPMNVSVGLDGQTLYIADTLNHRVRKVAPNGVITTVAGNGTAGFAGDGGPAVNASLSGPRDVVEVPGGILYIADTGNHRIRRVEGGTISTVAGSGAPSGSPGDGVALTTSLNTPSALAVGPDGSLYIAEYGGHRIRRLLGKAVQTIAGDGVSGSSGDGGPAVTARLSFPRDVAVSPEGVVYIADSANHRVRKVAGGIIQTVAGTGVGASSGDGGLATAAALNSPVGLSLTPSGALLVAEDLGNRVRRMTPEQPVTTFDYDAAGRQVVDGATRMVYNGVDQMVRVELGSAASTVEYAYGFDGQRIRTKNPDGTVERWFFSDVHERSGGREHYVQLGDRLLARVTVRPPASGAATGALVDPRPWTLLALALVLCALVVAGLRAPRAKGMARLASLLVLAQLAPACGSLLSSESYPTWTVTETIFFHQGFGPGPQLLTRADGSVLEERRHEPFGHPIDSYRQNVGGSGGTQANVVDYGLDPFNALNKPTDPSTGWSFHGARWMASRSARWLSPDPASKAPDPSFMTRPWGLNPYQYVEQNPILYWDPDGKDLDDVDHLVQNPNETPQQRFLRFHGHAGQRFNAVNAPHTYLVGGVSAGLGAPLLVVGGIEGFPLLVQSMATGAALVDSAAQAVAMRALVGVTMLAPWAIPVGSEIILAFNEAPSIGACARRTTLTVLEGGELKSSAGLIYGIKQLGNGAVEHRVDHVLAHCADNLAKKMQGVFYGGPGQALGTVDEAFEMIKAGEGLLVEAVGNKQVWMVQMGRSVGWEGGKKGMEAELSWVQLVLEKGADGVWNRVITAFPADPFRSGFNQALQETGASAANAAP